MRYFTMAAYAGWAVVAGALLPVQAGINVQLRQALGNPLRASLLQFVVGALFLLLATAFVREPWPALSEVLRGPVWMWLGGTLGASYVVSVIVLVPRLGAAFAFALVVAGQMLFSLAIDHFGWFGLPRSPVSPVRVVGGLMLVAGVTLLRR